ncbi:MAG TPA: class I SAM-dependent methyltransferase [Microthrixaceae bacterium]|nr:class I SAM-dependent methyltransferase [Microthrixaceae bacterium]
MPNLWTDPEHALWYLAKADSIPHRTEGEAVLLGLLPDRCDRFLDLGCGDGRLTALVLAAKPSARGTACDFNVVMLDGARERFEGTDVEVIEHDLDRPLGDWGQFDAVVSSFAIHHVDDDRKRSLATEVFGSLRAGGAFLNLEHVASPTTALHEAFLVEVGVDPADDDPSNLLASVEDNLGWMRGAGFVDVDCLWRWRELALLVGTVPEAA